MERTGQKLRAGDMGYDILPLFLHGRLLDSSFISAW
jgi:hypothetical protein